MDERDLRSLNAKIMQAREHMHTGRVWAADDALREAQRKIKDVLGVTDVSPRRERLVSRGLHRSRMPRTEE